MPSRLAERREKCLKWPKLGKSWEKSCTNSPWNKKYRILIWLMCCRGSLVDSRPFHLWWPMKLHLRNLHHINIKVGSNLVYLSWWFMEKITIVIIIVKHSQWLTMYREMHEHWFVVSKEAGYPYVGSKLHLTCQYWSFEEATTMSLLL